MAPYKFWKTQPVPQFNDFGDPAKHGPITTFDLEKISCNPVRLPEGYAWTSLDLADDVHLHELYQLLAEHYVTDGEFRFRYSAPFLRW